MGKHVRKGANGLGSNQLNLTIEIDREADGRWIAEVPQIPGVLAYGASEAEAVAKAVALAFRGIAERIEGGECEPIL